MDEQLKKDAHLLCERIRELTLELDKNIESISNELPKENIKIEIKEKENKKIFKSAPIAGRKGTKWDPTIINWKDSLRRPW
tara:strand:- start:237 stop:479 length:243 start_codon:yes stop_codon:yes gene_type:complete